MKLPVARFRCRNGHEFDGPTLGGGYGQFVLRSASGSLVSVDAFDDPVFSEVNGMVSSLDAVAALNDARRGAVVRAAFAATIDADAGGHPFDFSMHPPCPECGTTTMDWFEVLEPPQQMEVDVAPATHEAWGRLDDEAKLDVIREAVSDALSA